jgi:hypothetical protein
VHALEPPLVQLLANGLDPRGFAADPFFALMPLSVPSLLWTAAWTGGVLLLGVIAFGRREL